jgi:hypothetical protein
MTTVALVLGALLAVAAVVVVALPFLREPAPADDRLAALSPAERKRLAVAEERDQALAALKELELDHRTGKVTDEDYRALVGPLRRRAAETLRALDAYAARVSESPNEPEVPKPAVVPEPTPVPHEPVEPAVVPEPVPPPDEGDRPAQPDIPEPTPR